MLDQTGNCGCDSLKQRFMPLNAAITVALEQVRPVRETETRLLQECTGRVAAAPALASRAMPLFDNSAMDGFALASADCARALSLPISGTVAAGDGPTQLTPGTAMRIYTGAPIPEGADTVVMAEHCDASDGHVTLHNAPAPGDNIRRAGSDMAAGATLLRAGQRMGSRHIGLLAANGIGQCSVHRRVRVGVLSTGDELAQGALNPGQIHDANRPMLLTLAAQAGAEVTDLGVLPDDLKQTATALAKIRDRFDLVLSTGAVSIGGRDHIRAALHAAGGTLGGWRVAIKPGKPVAFGRLGSTVFTGLPGNPFAAYVGFHLFAGPQIACLSGAPYRPFARRPARAAFDWQRKPGRAEVFPAKLKGFDAQGVAKLERLGAGVSATLFPLADADGLAIVPAETAHVAPGDRLQWHPFEDTGDIR
ncbi:gephyrin-like molybdotransferase Glp [Pacificoceanicola onchidii]|uniref:molybdopterin molybdotransferase MoeA n=1 Tax=Pacificoceanicola onchidii TaxID=2562685 RepID=UPI0010A3DA16|nr:gephyrin-like molybdotransferase Glp [Pacificoceanicola onchidii]